MRRLISALVLLLAAAGLFWRFVLPAPNGDASVRTVPPPIPVRVVTVTKKDVPVYLDAIGTVQASATVTVQPMISGPLMSVEFHQGQDVVKGQVLARIDPRPYQAALDQAKAKLGQDTAELNGARHDLARYVRLAAQNYASAQQADDERATVAQLTALVMADQAAIQAAQPSLSYTVIRAPISGRTGIRQIDPGNIIQASNASGLVTITTLQPVDVVFSLPQQDLPAIQAAMGHGMPTVLATAEEELGAKPDRGRLLVLNNEVNQNTGTLTLKARFPNPKRRLWPGAFVTVRLEVRVEHGAVTVPALAVQQGAEGDFVFVVDATGIAHQRAVTLGVEEGNEAVIASGLVPGETVVTDGAAQLSDGRKVKVVPAARGARTVMRSAP